MAFAFGNRMVILIQGEISTSGAANPGGEIRKIAGNFSLDFAVKRDALSQKCKREMHSSKGVRGRLYFVP
jgi:hypothetical protein